MDLYHVQPHSNHPCGPRDACPTLRHHVRPQIRALTLVLALLVPSSGWAYDFEISARTEGYGYQLRRYDGAGITFLNRRRITQYLGLRIFNLLDDGAGPYGRAGRPPALLYLGALLRFDTDFGAFARPERAVPELENNQLDLMLGAVEGRNLLGGWLDFTLGRQFDAELMDFFAYDGLRVRVNLPYHLFVESCFGIQNNRERPFSGAVFEVDGVSGDRSSDALAPTFGVAGGIDDLNHMSLRVAYRGTASRAAPGVDQAPEGIDPDTTLWGVDQELVFFSIAYRVPVIHTRPLMGLRYNLLTAQFDDVQLGLSQSVGQRHDVQLEYLHSRPHFDGDSIFNLFNLEPFDEIAARYVLRVLDARLELSTRVGYRRFFSDEEEGDTVQPDAMSGGVGGRWRDGSLQAELDLFYLGGLGATTLGGDMWGSWRVTRRIDVEGRLSLVNTDDDSYAEDLLNFGFQVGGRVRLFHGVGLHLLVEDNVSRLYRSALRVLAVVELELAP